MDLKKRRGLSILCLVMLVGIFLALVSSGFAQEKKPNPNPVDLKPQKSKTPPKDANIKKTASNPNDPTKVIQAPPEKGGEARGGGPLYCQFHIDNKSPWNIQVYIDGYYRGDVGAWGDLYLWTGNGTTQVLGNAVFVDGSRLWWGPSYVNCVPGYVNGFNFYQ